MIAKSASKTMTKLSVDATPKVGVATASVMCSSAATTRGITTKWAKARPSRGQQQRRNDEGVDHAPRARMDRRYDEEPELLKQHRKPDDDAADHRELELGEDDVGRTERVQLNAAEILVHHPADGVLRRPEEHDGDRADGGDRDQKTVTELPQVLRERHLLLIPRRLRRFAARVAAPALRVTSFGVPRPGVGGGIASPDIEPASTLSMMSACCRGGALARFFARLGGRFVGLGLPDEKLFFCLAGAARQLRKFVGSEEQRADHENADDDRRVDDVREADVWS